MRAFFILLGLLGIGFVIVVVVPRAPEFAEDAIASANTNLRLDLNYCQTFSSASSSRANCEAEAREAHANAINSAENAGLVIPSALIGLPSVLLVLAGLFSKPKPKQQPYQQQYPPQQQMYYPPQQQPYYPPQQPLISIEQRLFEVDELRRKGVINDQEYQQMRSNILSGR
ncbi:MAG: hypothetical protein SFZ02_16560 [bacterium]|nr:hypothetical protein [bacterium]